MIGIKTIIDGNELISSIISNQLVSPDKKYILSKFCRVVHCGERTLLYNNLTKLTVELSVSEVATINSLPNFPSDDNFELISKWFLVPSDFNENGFCDGVFSTIDALSQKSEISSYTILTTTACNARCPYCFEADSKKASMTDSVAKKVAEFILEKSCGQAVKLSWFGGEPLLNQAPISLISQFLRQNNIHFSSDMTTNGYLFDDSLIASAVNLWKLKKVQITLDGTEEKYNAIKNYIYQDDQSPFKRVIKNINKLLESGIRVVIRLNISTSNYEDLFALVVQLNQLIVPERDLLSVYCATLYDLDGTEPIAIREENYNRRQNLQWYIATHGFRPNYSKFFAKVTSIQRECMALNRNSVLITPEGMLARCEHKFEKEDSYGSVFEGTTNQSNYDIWNRTWRISQCTNCSLYPSCLGITHCPTHHERCDQQDQMIRILATDNYIKNIYDRIVRNKETV